MDGRVGHQLARKQEDIRQRLVREMMQQRGDQPTSLRHRLEISRRLPNAPMVRARPSRIDRKRPAIGRPSSKIGPLRPLSAPEG